MLGEYMLKVVWGSFIDVICMVDNLEEIVFVLWFIEDGLLFIK